AQIALSDVDVYLDQARDVGGVSVIAAVVENIGRDELRELGEVLKDRMGSGIVVLGASVDDRPALIVGVTPDVIKSVGVKAGDVVKEVAAVAGGGGGGRPDFAQAGGGDVAKLGEAIDAVEGIVARQLSD
ncbi:MAG: DHHA1 domain-containing protein, partial [Candidatus Poribacteria bacterium]